MLGLESRINADRLQNRSKMFLGFGWHERDGIYIFSTNITAERITQHTHIEDPLQLQLYWAHISIQYSHPSETNKQKMNI